MNAIAQQAADIRAARDIVAAVSAEACHVTSAARALVTATAWRARATSAYLAAADDWVADWGRLAGVMDYAVGDLDRVQAQLWAKAQASPVAGAL